VAQGRTGCSAELPPEPDLAAPEPDVAAPEPDLAAPEPDLAAPEPDLAAPEPDLAAPEPDLAAPEPTLGTPGSRAERLGGRPRGRRTSEMNSTALRFLFSSRRPVRCSGKASRSTGSPPTRRRLCW
jgi:hypothetical protein